MQLILNEPKVFQGTMAKYGKFRNVNNYLVMAERKPKILMNVLATMVNI